jgi:hypothetical protein
MTPARRLIRELLGTALLLAAVVGTGIMGERLSGSNVAIALLANRDARRVGCSSCVRGAAASGVAACLGGRLPAHQ